MKGPFHHILSGLPAASVTGSPRDLGHWLRWYLSGCPTLQLPFHTVLFERKLCAAHTWERARVAQRWAEQLRQGLGVRAATVKGHSQLLAIMKTGEDWGGAGWGSWESLELLSVKAMDLWVTCDHRYSGTACPGGAGGGREDAAWSNWGRIRRAWFPRSPVKEGEGCAEMHFVSVPCVSWFLPELLNLLEFPE